MFTECFFANTRFMRTPDLPLQVLLFAHFERLCGLLYMDFFFIKRKNYSISKNVLCISRWFGFRSKSASPTSKPREDRSPKKVAMGSTPASEQLANNRQWATSTNVGRSFHLLLLSPACAPPPNLCIDSYPFRVIINNFTTPPPASFELTPANDFIMINW